ncbi:NACHT domain-containing protein [Streptomyces sp. NPDC059618]|uniref:NACHT domain-containing protein n=1 Tax=Streptomyces sp. NPDC059618 TaxID=3346887 RepID=UPI00369E0935
MDFDLYHLGPREFENLVQSIAVAELGPRVSVFGAGPDGGREATFDGSTGSRLGWDGYGILQVKHKEKPASPADEATWLIAEIRKEFKKWRTSTKRDPKPKHVIFASNVTLSAVPETGGFDRVEEVMQEECRKLDVESWMIWHSENVNRFLEVHDGIRRSYAAWILPGDILSSIYEDREGRKREVVGAIRSFLSREILRERYANLDQAGSADDRTIPLADVFVDLPISLTDDYRPDGEAKCLETLIASCDAIHRPDERQGDIAGHKGNRFVLVGGPGQGKSTVSQLFCQLYRALLVKETDLCARNSELRSAVRRIMALADRESLSPHARRWPFKIPLTNLADGIAKGKFSSVLEYVAHRVSAVSAIDVTASDLREWLGEFPWLLILDGFDEVPGSSNRDEVLQCINDFLLDADEVNADLVVVATTRPQGYADEFSSKHYQHYSLLPLDTENALEYGHKLAQARYGAAADDKVQRLMDRLEQAAAEDSTARLMTTPLQVTIMAVLLDRMGKAPKDRYTLFADYYRVIYERELEKEGPASNLLRDRKTDINAIHADIGLLLQTKSERSGDTASRLTLEELNVIIAARLEGEGFKGDALQTLTASISRAATDRLVFLVPSRIDEVSFEIRSLQEFWAADAIMNCLESEIPRRLRAMSVSAHWRNVLLFALGNIFENRKPLRDVVITLVAELNSASTQYGTLQRRILTGSRLAVEILRDGMVRAPRYEAILLEQALEVLHLPLSSHVPLLAASITPEGVGIARDFVQSELATDRSPRESILVFLGVRASHGDEWSAEVLRNIYARSTAEDREWYLSIASSAENAALVAWASRSMTDAGNTIAGARAVRRITSTLTRSKASSRPARALPTPSGPFTLPEWSQAVVPVFMGPARTRSFVTRMLSIGKRAIEVRATDCSWPGSRLRDAIDRGFPEEHWLSRIYLFSERPSKQTLADVVRVDGPRVNDYQIWAHRFPWIVLYALRLREQHGDGAASMIESGYMGDAADWLALEESWKHTELREMAASDFDSWRTSRSAFFPFSASSFYSNDREVWESSDILSLIEVIEDIRDVSAKSRLANVIFNMLPRHSIRHRRVAFSRPMLERAINCLPKDSHTFLAWLDGMEVDESWSDFLNIHGMYVRPGHLWSPRVPDFVVRDWTSDFSKVGLGRIAMSSAGWTMTHRRYALPIKVEWERIKLESNADPARRFLVALGVVATDPPHERDDQEILLQVLAEAVQAKEVSLHHVLSLVKAGHEATDYAFLVDLLDRTKSTQSSPEIRFSYDFLASYQASEWTEISFDTMRPC